MCGISGLISKSKINLELIKNMNNKIIHRGPDGDGHISLYGQKILLGHRRLSIIDLSVQASQPMQYAQADLTIVYNGELYNYKEIKQELQVLGYNFTTQSDTEVVLAAYHKWGAHALDKFNGMWAFVIIDQKRDKLFAARDNFGIKPLYFWPQEERVLAFASEIKQFTQLPGFKATLNTQRAYEFLNYSLHNHTDETLFDGVKQLKAGQFLEWDINFENLSNFKIKTWYQPKPTKFQGTFEEASSQFYSLLKDSIRLRLRSDVEMGMSLSGGLDSSSIVCLSHELLEKRNQKTFSIASDTPQFDESKYFNAVIQEKELDATVTTPHLSDLIKEYKKMIYHHDEPFVSTSIFAEWKVYQSVQSKDIKVILDGHGADETLAGYHPFVSRKLTSSIKNFRFVELYKDLKGLKHHHKTSYHDSFKNIYGLITPERLKQRYRKKKSLSHNRPEWINFIDFPLSSDNPFRIYPSSTIYDLSQMNLFYYSMPSQLHWADRDSMAHSIESRLPFLDFRLVEFLLSLPDNYKLHRGIHKRVLRDALKDSLPKKVLNRQRKMGFETAEEIWVKQENKEFFRAAFIKAVESTNGLINESAIQRFDKMVKSEIPFDFFIWKVIAFGTWIDTFKVEIKKG